MAVTDWAPAAEYRLGVTTEQGMSLVTPILSRRERIPAYQATGVTGSGEDVEITVGQIWPR